MSERNGAPAPPANLAEKRARIRELRADLRLRHLERAAKLQESLLLLDDDFGGGADAWTRLRRWGGDGRAWLPIAQPSDRRHGRHWPVWQSEADLDRLRQESRVCLATNGYAKGLLRNLTNYVLDEGFSYKVVSREAVDADPARPGVQDPERVTRWAAAAQDAVDRFLAANRWNGLADRGAAGVVADTRERELFRRVLRDGEAFVRLFFQEGGATLVRFVEPELVRQGPGATERDGWSFGIQHQMEPHEDVETRLKYHLAWPDPATAPGREPPLGELVSADDIVHVLAPDTDSTVKRGTPLFAFGVLDAFERAQKLQRNASIGAAIRAAVPETWEHAFGTRDQITSLATSLAERQDTNPVTGKAENVERIAPGTIRRIPEGQKLVPPAADNTGSYLQGAQGDLQLAAAAFCAPAYWLGDTANANYSNLETASAPAVKAGKAAQGHFKAAFECVVWRALQWAAACGAIEAESLAYLDVQATGPAVLHRNDLERGQVDQIYVGMGVKSPQTVAGELGLDYEVELANVEQHYQRAGPPGPGLPLPGEGGALGAGPPGGDAQAGAVAGQDLRTTVGGLQAIAALQGEFYAGKIPRPAAMANVQLLFGFSAAEAARLFPAVAPERLTPDEGGGGRLGESLVESAEGGATAEDDPDAFAGLVAEILYGLYGDDALTLFAAAGDGDEDGPAAVAESRLLEAWDELAHPRGKNGRFIPRGSAEAKAAAEDAIGKVIRGAKTPESAEQVAAHLSILTVKQLRELHKRHGVKIPGRLRGELVAAVKARLPGGQGDGPGAGRDAGPPEGAGRGLEAPPGGAGGAAGDRGGAAGGQPAGAGVARAVPRRVAAGVEKVNRRLDRYERLFRARGQHEVAEWMGKLRDHVRAHGVETALESLGDDLGKGDGGATHYTGAWEEDDGRWAFGDFTEHYLARHGVTLVHSAETPGPDARVVSPSTRPQPGRGARGGFVPVNQTLRDKLDEAKKLPGLEASEDVGVIVGRPVTHLTPDVMEKMDQRYGKGQWIIKSYSDSAYAGFGIYFPQRAAQIAQDARNTIWASGGELAKYGFSHLRDDAGTIVGIKHSGGDAYRFGTEKYNATIRGDARHWADRAAEAAPHERGAELPLGGKEFMAQPAFKAVGVSDADRAAGRTIAPGEGRVHIVTRDGKAEIIPHTTWIKGEHLPVVFETEDTRAMAKAALDAINALPASERQGQVYGPDILKAEDGYRVVEANPSNEAGGSGYMGDNPLIIDSYVSHITGRSPAHVRFVRNLLTSRKGAAR